MNKEEKLQNIAISTMIGMQTDIFSFLKILTKYEFYSIEVRMEKPHWDYDNLEDVKKLQDLLSEESIKAVSFHAPMWVNISNSDNYERVKSLREIEKAVLISERFNSENVIIHANGYSDCRPELKFKIIRRSLGELAQYAADHNIRILLENLFSPRITSDPDQIISLIDSYSEKHLGLCLDLGHLNLQNIEFKKLSENHYKRLFSIHLNDNVNGEKDEHLLPGMGNAPGQSKEDILKFLDNGVIVVIEAGLNIVEPGLLNKIMSNENKITSDYIDNALNICKKWRNSFFT